MVRNKKILAVAAITALLGVTSACGSDDDDSSSTSGGPEKADMVVWLNGADTPQEARDWLKETFEEDHPGSTLTIEEQEWDGLVERLTTALSSEDETPDVVEVGNTQAPTFTTAGAFSDLTGELDEWGGDDLLPGFVEAGDRRRQDVRRAVLRGLDVRLLPQGPLREGRTSRCPTTMEEFVAAAEALKADNARPANFSGYWLPGQDWRDGVAFLWDAGGDFASSDGGEWEGTLGSPESLEGLTTFQNLFANASGAPADANEADPVTPFCAGEIGMMSRPGWVMGLLTDPDAGCPDLAENVGVFALPGSDGGPAPVLLGGSDIAIAAQTQQPGPGAGHRRADAERRLPGHPGRGRPDPGAKQSLSTLLGDDEFAQATIEAASNAKLTPAAANWATVEGTRILEDLFGQIAQGGDVEELATDADQRHHATTRRLTRRVAYGAAPRGPSRSPAAAAPCGCAAMRPRCTRRRRGPFALHGCAPGTTARDAESACHTPHAVARRPGPPPRCSSPSRSATRWCARWSCPSRSSVSRSSSDARRSGSGWATTARWSATPTSGPCLRTVVFCFVNAALTMGIGVGIALLMTRMSRWVRLAVQGGLLLAWATPVVAAMIVWQFLFDTQYGVVNSVLTSLGSDHDGHSWLLQPLSFFASPR